MSVGRRGKGAARDTLTDAEVEVDKLIAALRKAVDELEIEAFGYIKPIHGPATREINRKQET